MEGIRTMGQKDIVIVSGVRTAVGSFMGSLSSVDQIDLAGLVIQEAVRRAEIPPEAVDEVLCSKQAFRLRPRLIQSTASAGLGCRQSWMGLWNF